MTKALLGLISVGDRIQWLRKKKGLSQVQLAKAVGISGPSVSNLETGVSKMPASTTLLRLAAVLEANPDWIISGRGDPYEWPTFTEGDEAELISVFKSLGNEQKAMMMAVAKSLKP